MISSIRFVVLAVTGLAINMGRAADLPMETLTGEGVWIAPMPDDPKVYTDRKGFMKVTVWFDKQWLGDGKGYERRAEEFAKARRRELRSDVMAALKKQSELSYTEASPELDRLEEAGIIQEFDRHWVVNGFSCFIRKKDLVQLKTVPGVRKVFFQQIRQGGLAALPANPPVPQVGPPSEPSFEELPWYIEKLKADRVWKEFKIAGQGTLNVIHDKNFIFSKHLSRTVYRNPGEIPANGVDDDGNGYIDDVHGYNFDRDSSDLYTRSFSGKPEDRRVLHGTNCATIASGARGADGEPQFGVAPLSRWAGVINLGGIERSVEWAIEQGADTYSMSFSRMLYGDYQSHWRKVMEHGAFCGVYFVSGAGNRRISEPEPFRMNIPQSIPNAVFAAAGVQRDLRKTPFSCVGPVKWQTEHYQDGVVQKPEVCAFNQGVPCLFPDGRVVSDLLNGNSYAGPMFCGTIALMLSADPDLLPWDLQEVITSTATDVGPEGTDYETGHGLIDCHAAVKEVLRRKRMR